MRICGIAGMRRCGIAKNEEMRNCQSEVDGENQCDLIMQRKNKEKEKKRNFG